MAITVNDKDLGMVTAYAYALSKGYTGTEEEFAELMASYATVAQEAAQSASNAALSASGAADSAAAAAGSATDAGNSASDAEGSASDAAQSKNDAAVSAQNAHASADAAAGSASAASGSATSAANSASAAATSETNAASSANAAAGSANDASGSANAAAGSAASAADSATAAAGSAAEAKAFAHAVSYEQQALTDGQKAQARTNIGAGSEADVVELKSALDELNAVEYSERTDVLSYPDVDWTNATDGMLQSDGTVSGSTGYCVSDYIPLKNVKKIFRHNFGAKYNLEAYALYDSSKNMIAGTYHVRTTNYDFTTYKNYTNVVFYDISAQGATYIRITKDKTLSYLFTEEYVSGYNYTIDGNIESNNIATLEEQAISFEAVKKAFNDKMLEAKAFIKYRTDRDITYPNIYINYNDGNILTGSAYSKYRTSDYIEVEAQKQYASGNGYSYACYGEDKTLLSYGRLFSSDIALRGTGRYWFVTTPENCKYIRICDAGNTSGVACGLQKVPEEYDIVNLGDSIFGVNPACFDISSIAQEKAGFNFANCGFGGSQASTYPSATSPYYSFNLWKLADAIYAEDFTEQDTSAEAIQESDGSILYVPRLTILKSVDFTKIRLLTIAYGTNDASKNTVLDNENDKYDKTTFCGALRYSIEKIYSKYPKINIALMSSPYGRKGTNNKTSTDTWTNSLGLHLMDYVDAMKSVAEEYHIPFFNHYSDMGVNDYNWQQYLRDGTHLSYIDGANLFGARVGQEVTKLLADYA